MSSDITKNLLSINNTIMKLDWDLFKHVLKYIKLNEQTHDGSK